MSFHVPNQYRVRKGLGIYDSDDSYGNNGVFYARTPYHNVDMKIVASDGFGWEHVSVSLPNRCPNWFEMCLVKDLFWDSEDTVMQLHPSKSKSVNNHAYCLHLWRPIGVEIPVPDELLVGIKELGELNGRDK